MAKTLPDLNLPAEVRSRLRHELLTPIISLQGFTELLLTPGISQQQRGRFVKIIHEEARRLVELVDDLLHE